MSHLKVSLGPGFVSAPPIYDVIWCLVALITLFRISGIIGSFGSLVASSSPSDEVKIKISAALIALTDFSVFSAFNGCRSHLSPHQPTPGALVAPVNWLRSAGIREIYFPHLSPFRYFFIPVLVPILKSLAASPLASTATFSTVHFSMSEAEYFSLVASSASPDQVVIKISTDPIDFTYFLYFQQVQFPLLAQD
jgi:hypothetical protein